MASKQQFDQLAKYLNSQFLTLKPDQRLQASQTLEKVELGTLLDHQKTVSFLEQVTKTFGLDSHKISTNTSMFYEKLKDGVKPVDSEQDISSSSDNSNKRQSNLKSDGKTEFSQLEYAGFQTPEQDLANLQTLKRFSTKGSSQPLPSYYTKLNDKIRALLIYLAQQEILHMPKFSLNINSPAWIPDLPTNHQQDLSQCPKLEEQVPDQFRPTNFNSKILMDSHDRTCCPNNHTLVRQSGVSKRLISPVYETRETNKVETCPECRQSQTRSWRSFYKHANTSICPTCFFKKETSPVKPCCKQCGVIINVDGVYYLCEEFEKCPNDFCLACVNQFEQRQKVASRMLRIAQEMQHVSFIINKSTQDHDLLFTSYLNNALECQWMLNQTKPPHSCLELLKLDSICQKWAEQTQSASVCVRLACLTGNISYLIRAILLLTQPNSLPLLGHEVIAPILSSSCPVPINPFHSAPLKIEVKIEPSQLKAKLKVLKPTLYQDVKDTTLRYVKNERAGRTLTDPILTRIQWFDPSSSEDFRVQSELIDKFEQEKLLNNNLNLVEEKFKNIDHFETVFMLTMITLVKKGSLRSQPQNTRDLKIIDMQKSQLVQQWVKQKHIISVLPLPEAATLPLCRFIEAEDTAKTCIEQMRAGKFNYKETLSNATLALLEPYFNFEINGHKFIENEAFKEYDFVFYHFLHWLGAVVAFSKAKIALGSQAAPCILALDQSTYEFQILSDDLNVIQWRDVQTKEKLASLFEMCKAKQQHIKMIEGWLSDDGKPYLSIAEQEDGKFQVQSYNLLSHAYNKKVDLPIVERQSVFQAMDIKNSYISLISNEESGDIVELIHLPTAVSILTQQIVSEPSVYLKSKPSEFVLFKKEQSSDTSEYVAHSVLKLSPVKVNLDYPLDLKQKMKDQETKYFMQKFESEEPSQPPLIEASGIEWALYLARIIEHHSAGEPQNQMLSHLNICCSEKYFKLIDKLIQTEFTDEPQLKAAKTQIMLAISQNLINNLKALKNKSLSKMIGLKQAIRLMVFHYTLDPRSIEHYVSAIKEDNQKLLVALTESDLPESSRQAISEFIVYSNSDKSQITLQRFHNEQLNKKVAQALLIKVVVGPPDNCKDLIGISKYVLESQSLSLLQAFVICLHTSKTVPKEILCLLSELLATRCYLPKETEKDILWLIGTKQVSILLKPMQKEEFQNYDHKGYLVTQSEIFSGGMDHGYLTLSFSQTTQDTITSCNAPILKTLFRNLKSGTSETQEETLSLQIIHPGHNQIVDEIIYGFEIHLKKRKPFLAQTGQQMGVQLSRAAFAVLIKLNYGQLSDFQELADLVEMESPCEEPGLERNLEVLKISQTFAGFQSLFELWENSSKIRMWLQAKKTSISDKIGSQTDGSEVREAQQTEHLSKIFTNILDKAEFLAKLETASFKSKQEVNISSLQRKPSYVKADQQEQQPKFESHQAANQEAKMREARKAAAESVIACLESPVLVEDIKNQVEILFTQAIRRLAALSFIDRLLVEDTPIDQFNDLLGWFSNLQSSSGKLTHYMDGIRGGCSIQIEEMLREVFFSIIKKLAIRLASTTCAKQANIILRSLQWQFQARDFKNLFDQIDIFKLLSKGDGSVTSIVAKSWAKLSSENWQLSRDLSSTIKDLFFAVLGRVTDNSAAQMTKLKVQGSQTLAMLVPSLQRVKSIVDQDVSSVLLDSAVRVVFRSFHDITTKYNQLAIAQEGTIQINHLTCNQGHKLKPQNQPLLRSSEQNRKYDSRDCDLCQSSIKHSADTYYTCGQGCSYDCCKKCFDKKQQITLDQILERFTAGAQNVIAISIGSGYNAAVKGPIPTTSVPIVLKCDSGNPLKKFTSPVPRYNSIGVLTHGGNRLCQCGVKLNTQSEGEPYYTCGNERCNCDYCQKCYDELSLPVLTCDRGHRIQRFEAGASRRRRSGTSRACDHCRFSFRENSSASYTCNQGCDYDCCERCYVKRSATKAAEASSSVIANKAEAVEENVLLGLANVYDDDALPKNELKLLESQSADDFLKQHGDVFLDDLIQMMLVLTSVSGVSTSARQVLIKIARPEYIVTLFELLLTPIKIEHMFKVLAIIENLKKLQVSLELPAEFQSQIKLPQIKLFDDVIANTLFYYAALKQNNNKRDQAKILLRTARKFVTDLQLRLVLDEMSKLEEQYQILLMMMLDSGLEVRQISFGSSVTLISPPLRMVEDILTVIGTMTKNEKVYYTLFSQLQNKCMKHQATKLKPIDRLDSVLPQTAVLIQSLITTTSHQLKCAVLNFLSNNCSFIDDFTLLQNYLQQILAQDSFRTQIIQLFEGERSGFSDWYQPDELEQQIGNLQGSPDSPAPSLAVDFYRHFDLQQINVFTAFKRLDCEYPDALNQSFKELLGSNSDQQSVLKELNKLLTLENLQEWTQKVTDLQPETKIEIQNAENLTDLTFNMEKVEISSIEPLPKDLVSMQFYQWLKALTIFFKLYQGSEPTILWHLHQLYSQIKRRNQLQGLKKTGVTKRWLAILMKATPEFRSQYVSRILRRQGRDVTLLLKLALKLIETDADICTEYSCLQVQLLMKFGNLKVHPLCFYFTDWICRVLLRITQLQDKESALKICELTLTVPEDQNKKWFKVLLNQDNDRDHYKIQTLRKTFSEMCTAFGVESEFTKQLSQKNLEFLKTKGIEKQQFDAAIPGQFATFKCDTLLMFNSDPVFGVNVIEVKVGDGESKYIVIPKDKYNLKLPKKAEEIRVRVFEGSHFLCSLKDQINDFIELPENTILQNPKLYLTSKERGDDDLFYLTNQVGDKRDLYLVDRKIPFDGDIKAIVTIQGEKSKQDILIDGQNQPYLISDEKLENFKVEPLFSAYRQIEHIAVLNNGSRFFVIVGGKLSLMQNGQETELQFEELKSASQIKIVSQRALLKETWEKVILDAKSSDGQQFQCEIEFGRSEQPTFKFLQYHDYDSFAFGASIAWGIEKDGKTTIISGSETNSDREIFVDTYPSMDQRAFQRFYKSAMMDSGSGPLIKGFHGDADRGQSFWVYPEHDQLVTPQWDTHGNAKMFCRTAVFLGQEGSLMRWRCQGHSQQAVNFNLKTPVSDYNPNWLACAIQSQHKEFHLFKNTENNSEMKFLKSDSSILFSQEQVAEQIQRLNLLIDKENISGSFNKLCRETKTKIGLKDCQESDFLDHQILKLNKNFRSNLKIIKAMVKEKKCDLSELTAFRSQFVLPQIDNAFYLKIVNWASYLHKEIKIVVDRLDQTESLFEQLFRQTSHITKIYLRQFGEQPFRCLFKNEGAADYGGPFRDFMEQVFKDVSEIYFEFTSSIHQESEKRLQIPYTSLNDSYKDIERYKYIGIMIGYALRNVYCIPLDFSPIFWKRVLKIAVTFEDLEHADSTRYNQLQSILSGQEQTVFAADFGDGVEIELCSGGAAIAVTPENSQRYVQLYIQKYLSLNQTLYDNLILGIEEICPREIIAVLNLNNIGRIACSAPTINLDELKKSVKFNLDYSDEHLKYFEGLFWAMIDKMSNAERSLLLRFITGSSRLDPSNTVSIDFQEVYNSGNSDGFDWGRIEEFKASPEKNIQNKQYPIAHTCGFSVDVPLYTNLEMMIERITTAINICGQIDNDFEMGNERDYWEQDSYYANLRSDSEQSFSSHHRGQDSEQYGSESDESSSHRSENSDGSDDVESDNGGSDDEY